jgi:hypothetical protein
MFTRAIRLLLHLKFIFLSNRYIMNRYSQAGHTDRFADDRFNCLVCKSEFIIPDSHVYSLIKHIEYGIHFDIPCYLEKTSLGTSMNLQGILG